MEEFVHEEEEVDHPLRYLPIGRLYSPSPDRVNPSGSPKIMSKKVKARRLLEESDEGEEKKPPDVNGGGVVKPILVYQRRSKRPRPSVAKAKLGGDGGMDFEGNAVQRVVGADGSGVGCGLVSDVKVARKRRKSNSDELLSPNGGTRKSSRLSGIASSERINYADGRRRLRKDSDGQSKHKRWVELSIQGADPHAFVGLACKVYWPMDEEWYKGSVTGFDSVSQEHCVEYEDGDVEKLVLLDERIKFHASHEQMECLNLKCGTSDIGKNGLNYDEMLALAVTYSDCQDLEPGDLVWAKLTGHAMWPAVIMNESFVGENSGLKCRGDRSVLVQFFGTHDFARINLKQAVPFLNGLLSSLHLKCKQTRFYHSIDEAKTYLSKQLLPERMLRMQRTIHTNELGGASFNKDDKGCNSSEDNSGGVLMQQTVECIRTPLDIGDLCVTNLGKVVHDSEYFHNKQYIWPEGYTAVRKFISMKDPSLIASYKMEVLRNPKVKARPLFRVTIDNEEQIDGPNPTACWEQIYDRIKKNLFNGIHAEVEECDLQMAGSYMFGFSYPEISQLIQVVMLAANIVELSILIFHSSVQLPKSKKERYDLHLGFRAVHVEWKDLDRCSVCHMDEEYEDDLFLQCEKCRIMVHARCYGELEPLDGVLWLCNLCRAGAPTYSPRCCLCPVTGGVMKPTTDGRWAHLACAMWIPETCLLDVKRMEPIDGLSRITKDRWKLLCSICGVPYGACIQCSNRTCRVAYHPLCARAAGLCVELEGEDNLHQMSLNEKDDHCIRLLSFCKKHSQPSGKQAPTDESEVLFCPSDLGDAPAQRPSGCARIQPYKFLGKTAKKDHQAFDAASKKQSFVENTPYLVTGYRQNGIGSFLFPHESAQALGLAGFGTQTQFELFGTMAEKYESMKQTFRKRLTFGKSRIHGFGVFAKCAHKAGDMIIEYTGELVRSPIADIREHSIYNALVGAGTYMFRIDDERVIDATRAGSIAHLVNHSCEPNCFSRMVSVNSCEHIIIFAKRDIDQWEELTYDYRYFSTDKQLPCNCGFPRCRGVVNDLEAEEQVAKTRVPRCHVIHCREQ